MAYNKIYVIPNKRNYVFFYIYITIFKNKITCQSKLIN